MSFHIIDFTSDNRDFNFDNVIIGRKIKINGNLSKYYVYYQGDNQPNPCEIYIKLPRLRLIYSLGNHKYDQIKVPIYPNWDATNEFISFIHKLEEDTKTCFSSRFPNLEFVSLISKKNAISFIKTNIYEKVKITSDINKSNVTLNDFKINGQIEMVIKISYIWNKDEIKFGFSSNLYQIKYYGPPEQLDVDFIDPESPKITDPMTSRKTHIPPPPPLPNITQNENTIMPPQLGIKLVPSIKDLESAIKKLKPSK